MSPLVAMHSPRFAGWGRRHAYDSACQTLRVDYVVQLMTDQGGVLRQSYADVVGLPTFVLRVQIAS